MNITLLIFVSILGLSRRFGTLPFLPFAWFVYSLFLVFKVGIIFTTYVTHFQINERNPNNCSNFYQLLTDEDESENKTNSVLGLGSNLLKVAVGSSALLFIIILQVKLFMLSDKSILPLKFNTLNNVFC